MPRICRDVKNQTTRDTSFQIAFAEVSRSVGGALLNSHVLPDYQITSTTAITVGDEVADLQLTSPPAGTTSVTLYAGEQLRYPGATVAAPPVLLTVLVDTVVTATATPVPIAPARTALPAAAVAKTKALRFLVGCYNATVTPQYKAEDTTDYTSGMGTTQIITSAAMQVNCELNLVYDDPIHDRILAVIYDLDQIGTHVFVQISMNSGERIEGWALVNSATPQAGVQAKRTIQIQLNIQGECYDYKPANKV